MNELSSCCLERGKGLLILNNTKPQLTPKEHPEHLTSSELFFTFMCSEKEMATHSSILAWRIPWTEEPGRLQSMGS